MLDNAKSIKNAIYQEEIFLEKRHRIILKDIFLFQCLCQLHIIYIAQSEKPIDGEYRHGYAIYAVKEGKAVRPDTLRGSIIFHKLPAVSKLVDVEAPDPDVDELDYQICLEEMNDLLASLKENHSLSPDELDTYYNYLSTMKSYRPKALENVYDFFLENLPEPDYSRR